MTTVKDYERDCQQMLAATRAWRRANPGAELLFRPLGHAEDTFVIAGLSSRLIEHVSGNPNTRDLLHAMNAASRNQGTVQQADACLEIVFGFRRALSGQASKATWAVS